MIWRYFVYDNITSLILEIQQGPRLQKFVTTYRVEEVWLIYVQQ